MVVVGGERGGGVPHRRRIVRGGSLSPGWTKSRVASGIAAFGLLVGALVAVGAPVIIPTSHPSNNVSSDQNDYVEFNGGLWSTDFGTTITITSPENRALTLSLQLQGVPGDIPGTDNDVVRCYFDGRYEGPASPRRHWLCDASLGPSGFTRANGTWTIHVGAVGNYDSTCENVPIRLSVKGKNVTFGYSQTGRANVVQHWNRHIAPTSVTDDGGASCAPIGEAPPPPPTGLSELSSWEDPNNGQFIRDLGQDADPVVAGAPRSATGGFTVNCATSTVTIEGTWVRGTSQTQNTFAWFHWINGQFQPVQGGSVVTGITPPYPGSVQTTVTDKGAGASGSHSATIPYNNAIGNSYQFVARNGTTGQFPPGGSGGRVNLIPAGACTIAQPSITGFVFNPAEFQVEVSQAQCRGDPVSFAVNSDVIQTLNDMDAFIYDTETGTVVMQIDDSQMIHQPSGGSTGFWFFNRTLDVGPWLVLARGDFGGIGAVDFFATRAFNVPFGDCADLFQDITDLIPILVQHNASMHEDHLTIMELINGIGNLTVDLLSFGFEVDGTTTLNVFLLLLFGVLAVWVYLRSGNILGRTLGAACALVGMLIAVAQVSRWVGMLVVVLILGVLSAYLFFKASVEFMTARRGNVAVDSTDRQT